MLDAKFHITSGTVLLLLVSGAGLWAFFFLFRRVALPSMRGRQAYRKLARWLDLAHPLLWASYLIWVLAALLSANFLVTGFLLAAILIVGLDYWRRQFSAWVMRLEERIQAGQEEGRTDVQSILLSFPVEEKSIDARQLLQLAQKCPWILADDALAVEEKGEGKYLLRARLVDAGAADQVQDYFCNLAVRK